MRELNERVAVVTGGASGIGRALAGAFADRGMKVGVADIDRAALDTTMAVLRAAGATVIGHLTDVADEQSVANLAQTAFAEFGSVHLLCNNAGVGAQVPVISATLFARFTSQQQDSPAMKAVAGTSADTRSRGPDRATPDLTSLRSPVRPSPLVVCPGRSEGGDSRTADLHPELHHRASDHISIRGPSLMRNRCISGVQNSLPVADSPCQSPRSRPATKTNVAT